MKNKIIFFIALLLLAALVLNIKKEDCMSIETNGSTNQVVSFSGLSTDIAAVTKTALIWLDINSIPASSKGIFQIDSSGTVLYLVQLQSSGNIAVWSNWTSTRGIWETSALTTGKKFIAITYDGSSDANDPVVYVNNVSLSITETSAPTGSFESAVSSADFDLGFSGLGGSNYAIDGNYMSVALYDYIFSAQEIADAYNSRLAIPTQRGLVFAPMLCGISGGAKDGDTMTGSNQIADIVSGAKGTPSGSPVFRADDYLIWGGE